MHEAPSTVERAPRLPLWAMLLPAATLVVGLAIGAAVGGAGHGASPQASAAPTVSVTATASPSTVDVQVPVECLQLAQEAATALPPIDDAKQAVNNLDLQKIQAYIAQMQTAEPRLRDLAQQCRDKSGNVQLGTLQAPTPTPSAS